MSGVVEVKVLSLLLSIASIALSFGLITFLVGWGLGTGLIGKHKDENY